MGEGELAVRVAACLGMGGKGVPVTARPGKNVVGQGVREGMNE